MASDAPGRGEIFLNRESLSQIELDTLPPFEDDEEAEDAVEDADGRRKRKRSRILSMSEMVGMAAAEAERPWGKVRKLWVSAKEYARQEISEIGMHSTAESQ